MRPILWEALNEELTPIYIVIGLGAAVAGIAVTGIVASGRDPVLHAFVLAAGRRRGGGVLGHNLDGFGLIGTDRVLRGKRGVGWFRGGFGTPLTREGDSRTRDVERIMSQDEKAGDVLVRY